MENTVAMLLSTANKKMHLGNTFIHVQTHLHPINARILRKSYKAAHYVNLMLSGLCQTHLNLLAVKKQHVNKCEVQLYPSVKLDKVQAKLQK